MATKPTAKPKIAFDTVNLPNAGTTNKMQPRLTWQNTGFDLGDNATAQEFNWLFSNNYDWINYFEEKTDDLQTESDDYETRISAIENAPYQSLSQINTLIANAISANNNILYPIGKTLISTNSANPNSYLGFGTWVQTAQGRAIFGAGTTTDTRGENYTLTAGTTGGEKQHVLTESEMPSHTHRLLGTNNPSGAIEPLDGTAVAGNNEVSPPPTYTNSGIGSQQLVEDTGGDSPHNNMPPYEVFYVFKRTA